MPGDEEVAMFSNVLVGVDGRANGRDAIALASRLLDGQGTLTLAHVFGGSHNPVRALAHGGAESDRAGAEQLLAHEREQAGVQAELAAVEGAGAGRALHEQAESQGADLLVLGTSHRGLLGRTLLGDETRAALDGSPCAVAVAPAGYAHRDAKLAAIGLGYDGSPESEAALGLARELAQRVHASVRALELVAIPYYEYTELAAAAAAGAGDIAEERVKSADERMKALPGVQGEARYGLAGEELAALSGEVDLLIVGSRGFGPVKRLMVGSTSHYLLRHARCPLLILARAQAAESGADGSGSQRAVSA
jgi:nucleotide-binding universal stress UspA family protein